MKRYLVFAGLTYYPSGGWSDYYGTYDTLEDALRGCITARDNYDWTQVIDTTTMSVEKHGG